VVLEFQTNLHAVNSVSFAVEMLVNSLFQNGCLAFRYLVGSDLRLKLKSSVMSALFQAWPDDL
jgi:hypothetical protein